MTPWNRRAFLKASALSASGALFLRSRPLPKLSPLPPADQPLIKRKLGNTGLVLPVVSFGVMRSDNPGLVRAALKAGIVHLDTAHGYQRGNNEEMLGRVLMDFPRDSFVISTKIPPEGKEEFLSKLDLSLRRLRMDYVNILYLHGVSSRDTVLSPELIETLKAIKVTGKAHFVGVSTHQNEPEVIQAITDSHFYDVVLTAINFRQDHQAEVRKAIANAGKAGVGVIAMKTMAGAFFDKDREEPINCRAALKWVLQDENIATSIPGITSFDHLNENLSVATDLTLTDQEKAQLRLGQTQGGLYCNSCGQCRGTCGRTLPIPELMRAYMYTFGYGDARRAREMVLNMGVDANPCVGCSTCTVSCKKSFPVRERIENIARLQSVPAEILSGAEFL
jgi:predicted aldo/keto reductase-like oxidoreductase